VNPYGDGYAAQKISMILYEITVRMHTVKDRILI
jgi:hypothetical protein